MSMLIIASPLCFAGIERDNNILITIPSIFTDNKLRLKYVSSDIVELLIHLHRRANMTANKTFIDVEAELMTIKEGKQYIISHEKQATIEPAGDREGADFDAYVIEHADIVRDYDMQNRYATVANVRQAKTSG